ncbi:hypothetical protein GWL_24240 [Herbaspirillum sp. GW103]|nr:hypothetical protein GWL_24240 [Herbaspirillum sp. GW103]
MESAVGVGECGRDEELARCGSAHWRYGRCKWVKARARRNSKKTAIKLP